MMLSFTLHSPGPTRRCAMTVTMLLPAICSMLWQICCDMSGLSDWLATPILSLLFLIVVPIPVQELPVCGIARATLSLGLPSLAAHTS